MARSYVSAGTVQRLTYRVMPNVFETQVALNNGGVTLVLARANPVTGEYDAIPPQIGIFKYAGRQEQVGGGESANITTVGGEITFLSTPDSPVDVQADDIFTLEDIDGAVPGRIVAVHPPKLGRQKATWELRVGGI